ncbi:hypothetical protein PMAYCL1PPCAC_29573, partial [Pristionchus mayeri]
LTTVPMVLLAGLTEMGGSREDPPMGLPVGVDPTAVDLHHTSALRLILVPPIAFGFEEGSEWDNRVILLSFFFSLSIDLRGGPPTLRDTLGLIGGSIGGRIQS